MTPVLALRPYRSMPMDHETALRYIMAQAVAHFSGQDPLPSNVLHTYFGKVWLCARTALGLRSLPDPKSDIALKNAAREWSDYQTRNPVPNVPPPKTVAELTQENERLWAEVRAYEATVPLALRHGMLKVGEELTARQHLIQQARQLIEEADTTDSWANLARKWLKAAASY